jgi:predicted thioesterase
MTTPLFVGAHHAITVATGPEHTARCFHANLPDVVATPFLAGFMEKASAELIEPALAPGQQSVGAAMDLKHVAATPLGMPLRIRTEVIALEGKKLTFRLEAWDDVEKIGEATHVRYIISAEKFNAGVAQKTGPRGG